MADKKRAGKGSDGSEQRPRIHTSHGTQPRATKSPRRGLAPRRAQAPNATSHPREGDEPRQASPKLRKAKAPVLPTASIASDDARRLAVAIATAALEKKAVGLEVLDVAGRVDYADFLVLMTGRSDRQVVALAQAIEEELRKRENRRPLSVEGLPHAHWVLMDFGDVVVHVFQEEARGLYDLDGLWMDASRLPLANADEPRER